MEKYLNAGQSHLFEFWNQLSESEQREFLCQLSKYSDPEKLVKTVKEATRQSASNQLKNYVPLTSDHSLIGECPEKPNWEAKGLELINKGQVGVILMAGGQGTRLGSSSPKGCFDVGLPSKKTLFQLQAERIIKITQLANAQCGNNKGSIAWYIMTSSATRAETESFFRAHDFFGLHAENVTFFNQGTLPCFDETGEKILMNGKGSICESPDGNGGLYRAILENGLLEEFARKDIKHIHMYCVDNCLVRVADPVFIGWAASHNFEIATKVVRKNNPTESVGVIAMDSEERKPRVIEYSEISQELTEKRDGNGLLLLRAANIVNHYYNVDVLREKIPQWIESQTYLPFHLAKKKIPCLGDEMPVSANGIKLEQFIFDVFPSIPLSKFGCLEVKREEEFSPLKNGSGSGSDCPETSKRDLLALGTKWVSDNGGVVAPDAHVEVSPLTSYAGEGMQFVSGKDFHDNDSV